MIRVLVVDDSAFMRKVIGDLISSTQGFEVIGYAKNGKEAIDQVKALKPTVVTLDVEMPVMDGLTALEIIMRECPVPVVMLSSLTHKGADATIKALSLGAVDFIAKAGASISSIDSIKEEIIRICKGASNVKLSRLGAIQRPVMTARVKETPCISPVTTGSSNISAKPICAIATSGRFKIVAIGTSTGGPRALQEVITKLPKNYPYPVVVVQHMTANFTKSLADRLDSLSQIKVKEAEQDDLLVPGQVYIAPGGYHMRFVRRGQGVHISLSKDAAVNGHRPAADPMFESVSKVYGSSVIAVLMTGMGSDGAIGMKFIKDNGGYNIAESQETAVVFGMPKAAIEKGVVDKVVGVGYIAQELIELS